MRKLKISTLILIPIVAATLQVNAQVVKIPGSDAYVVTNANMPVRGLTKIEVETKFGQPHTRQGPTGIPAIYRWDYETYSVFFEDNYVIHTVAH